MTDATTTPTDKAGEHCDVHHLLVEFANSIKGASLDKRIEYLRVFTDRINALTHPQPSLSVGLDREAAARVRDLADAIEAHLLGSPGNFEIAVSYLDETERDFRSLLALAAPADGYVLVPVEPTEAMLDAMFAGYVKSDGSYREAYRAMIAACLPAAPTGGRS